MRLAEILLFFNLKLIFNFNFKLNFFFLDEKKKWK